MINNLIIGGLVYNEEHKFLKQWLDTYSQLSNKIVIIDDGSTDNSVSICSKYTSNIYQTNRLLTKNEAQLKSTLWEKCTELANNNDYIFIVDNDELLTNNSILHFEETLFNCEKSEKDSISHLFYDMWNNKQYREDPPLWQAHKDIFVWCVKYKKDYKYYWDNNLLHSKRLPINGFSSIYKSNLQIKHMAYSTLDLRKAQKIKYEILDSKGMWTSKQKYDSILDENPTLIDFKDNFEESSS